MRLPILFSLVAAGCFLALAHAAVTTPREQFRRMTTVMIAVAAGLVVVAPAAGAVLLGPVLLSRRLAHQPIPSTVPEFLGRYEAAE